MSRMSRMSLTPPDAITCSPVACASAPDEIDSNVAAGKMAINNPNHARWNLLFFMIFSMRTLLPAVIVGNPYEMRLLVGILENTRAIRIGEIRPGPVIGIDTVVNVLQTYAGILLYRVFGKRLQGREFGRNIGQ